METNISALQIEFRQPHIFLELPLNGNGCLYRGGASAKLAPQAIGEQCPDCGGDVCETWTLHCQDGGQAPYAGSAVRADCECGHRATGEIVEVG